MSLQAITRWFNVLEHGARGNGLRGDSRGIVEAINASLNENINGGRVIIPPTNSFYVIDEEIAGYDELEIYISAGAVLKLPPGATWNMFSGSGLTRFRVTGGGTLLGSGDFAQAYAGIDLSQCQECDVSGLRLALFGGNGVVLDGDGYNHVTRVYVHDCGLNGVWITGGSQHNSLVGCHIYSNGQADPGNYDGVHLDAAAVRNTVIGCHIWEPAQTYAPAQAYPVRETGTCDYNTIVGLESNGHVTSDDPSLVGGHSKWLDNFNIATGVTIQAATLTGTTTLSGNVDGGGTGVISGTEVSGGSVVNSMLKGPKFNVTSVVGPTTYAVASMDAIVKADASAGAVTLDLPAATGSGDMFILTKEDSSTNSVTVAPNGTDKIDGFANRVITGQHGTVIVVDTNAGVWQTFAGGPVGASDGPRLNGYYLSTGIIPTSQVSGTGDVTSNTPLTIQGLSSTASVVKMRVAFACNTVGAYVSLFDSSGSTFVSGTIPVLGNAVPAEMYVEMRVTPGSTNQVYYRVSGTSNAAWTLSAYCLGYMEPS